MALDDQPDPRLLALGQHGLERSRNARIRR